MNRPDIDAIAALDAMVLADHTRRAGDEFDIAVHRQALHRSLERSQLICVARDGMHVAHTYFWPHGETVWFVGGFSIHPQYRNASVLGELGRRVAQIMDEKEIGSLVSHVYRTNTLSLAFHRRLGFSVVAQNEKGFALSIDRVTLERSILGKRARLARGGGLEIRMAREDDAVETAALLRRSIAELCAADHNNDAARLSHWLSNKTPQHYRGWVADPLNTMIVATHYQRIVGAGGLRAGEGIVLNYVHPDARFLGVSNALIAALEAMLRERGVKTAYLTSTLTARRFYEARGYRERDLLPEARPQYGIAMEKALALR